MVQPKYLKKKVPNWRSRTYLYKVGFWVHVMIGLISAQMISEKGCPALVFRLLILLLLSLITEIATTGLSMAGYHQDLHRRSNKIPVSQWSSTLPIVRATVQSICHMGLYPTAETLPRAWWTSHVALSLDQYGITRHGCLGHTIRT